eukprot:381398-Rhodomonas_salina.1
MRERGQRLGEGKREERQRRRHGQREGGRRRVRGEEIEPERLSAKDVSPALSREMSTTPSPESIMPLSVRGIECHHLY